MKSMLRLRSWASSMISVSYAQQPVALQLGQQDAVGHQLDQRVVADLVGEPHLVADRVAQLGAQLLGDPLGHAAGRDPARLGVPDHAAARPAPAPGRSSGSWVVLPDPVSPATITTWWSRIASAISSRRCADRQLVGEGEVRHQAAAALDLSGPEAGPSGPPARGPAARTGGFGHDPRKSRRPGNRFTGPRRTRG